MRQSRARRPDTSTMKSESGVYIARLDHLRFFAAALVPAGQAPAATELASK